MAEWKLKQDLHNNGAEFRAHTTVEIDIFPHMGDEDLSVSMEAGFGWDHVVLNKDIPVSVIIKLLEHAGYAVTKKA